MPIVVARTRLGRDDASKARSVIRVSAIQAAEIRRGTEDVVIETFRKRSDGD